VTSPDQLLTGVGVAVAAIGLSLTFLQLVANARESFADRRPYVIVSLKLEKQTGFDDSVYVENFELWRDSSERHNSCI
jgi:hypothetical protein